jgi:hypothetical protein
MDAIGGQKTTKGLQVPKQSLKLFPNISLSVATIWVIHRNTYIPQTRK